MPVVVAPCPGKCKSEFQDKLYGAGNRVHNTLKGYAGTRCTVCKYTSKTSVKKEAEETDAKPVAQETQKPKSKPDRDRKGRATKKR